MLQDYMATIRTKAKLDTSVPREIIWTTTRMLSTESFKRAFATFQIVFFLFFQTLFLRVPK